VDADDDTAALAAAALENIRLMAVHYGLWFSESVHQFGLDAALHAESRAGDLTRDMVLKRLSNASNPFANLSKDQLETFLDIFSKLWLGMDGVWFQAVESLEGMDAAKRVNDTCWARFAPLEAVRIKAMLNLTEQGGLVVLEEALKWRMNNRVNEVAVVREANSLTFRVLTCRVQAARRRKGLQDYPCKSAGLTEYRGFARHVDSRIRTECLACPPDDLAPDEFCSWRFTLENDQPEGR